MFSDFPLQAAESPTELARWNAFPRGAAGHRFLVEPLGITAPAALLASSVCYYKNKMKTHHEKMLPMRIELMTLGL